ncbi:hypothetical protein JOM56_002630 [Amanita muscaria]
MVKHTQTLHQITRLIAEKAMEESYYACTRLMMMEDTNGDPEVLFDKYLGEICQENLGAFVASVAGADEHTARTRCLRLIRFIGALTNIDFDLFSDEIMQWVNTKDTQTLSRITRLIVEAAVDAAGNPNPTPADCNDPFVRLYKAMMEHTQTLHQIPRVIVEKVMEEPRRFDAYVQLCNMMVKYTNYSKATVTADASSFGEYLGEICQENLETIAASVAAAGNHTARIRRLRLIHFIEALGPANAVGMWTPAITDKWMTALLEADDEEKVVTLCMLMARACVDRWSYHSDDWGDSEKGWFRRVTNVAQESSKPRVRKLLQNVTKDGRMNWGVAEPSEDCTVQ